MTISRYVHQMVRSEGLWWGSRLIFLRLFASIRSAMMAHLLNANKIRVAGRLNIRGLRHIKFGERVVINGDVWIEALSKYGTGTFTPKIEIGSNVAFSAYVHITCIDSVTIGSGVLFGSKVFVGDHDHGVYRGGAQSNPLVPPAQRELGKRGPVMIEENVWLGDNVVVLGPARIGAGAIVGANSVVTGYVPSNSIVAGIPARVVKTFNVTENEWK